MSEEDSGKKKGSWLVTCGVLAVVFGLGFVAVAGVGGWYAYTRWYAPPAEASVVGLLSVVNNSGSAAAVNCTSPDGHEWTLAHEVADTETAQLEIGHRPCVCTLTTGDRTIEWALRDPPAADETWTVTLPPHEAPAVTTVGTLKIDNTSGQLVSASCTWAGSAEMKEIPTGSTVEIAVGARPATCALSAGSTSKTWSISEPAAADETWTLSLVPEGAGGFAISGGNAVADAATPPVEPTVTTPTTPAPATPAASSSTSSSSTSASTSSSTSSSSSRGTSTASGGTSRTPPSVPTTTTTTTTTSSSSTSSSGSGGVSRTPPPAEEEDEELPDAGVLSAIKVEWAKGAKKSTPWNVVVDSKKLGAIPQKQLVSSGVHKIKLTASGEDPFECTVTAAGGEDIVLYFDPDNKKCPR